MFFRTQTGWSWNFRSCLQDLVLKKTYSTSPSTTICFHLWKSNNQTSKWASKTTAWSRVRCTVHRVYIAGTPLVFALFLPYPSCPSLPSAFQAVFPGTPYFLTLSCKRCNNWQAPRLEKRVTRSMISYFTICFGIQTCKYRFTLIAHDCLQVALLSKSNFTWCKMM